MRGFKYFSAYVNFILFSDLFLLCCLFSRSSSTCSLFNGQSLGKYCFYLLCPINFQQNILDLHRIGYVVHVATKHKFMKE